MAPGVALQQPSEERLRRRPEPGDPARLSSYETARIATYWVVDPDAPSLTAWQLVDGQYVEVGRAEGDELFELAVPFAVQLRPSDLLA